MKLLDRYVLRSFIEPFIICFLGFLGISLIFDMAGNLQDFMEASASLKQIALFYATQIPQVVVISLPVGLLLALLYSVSRMSRSNEIISMLSSGRSIIRLVVPHMLIGLLATAACLILNYEWAPHAEAVKKAALEQITRGKKSEADVIEAHVFRDRQNNRTWFVRKLRSRSPSLEDVHITQQEPDGRIVSKWYAKRALYDARSRSWTLKRGMRVDFTPEGDIKHTEHFPSDSRTITTWSETPWRIESSNLEAQNLSIPELRDYLKHNADFPPFQLAPYESYLLHRWAFPWQCFIVVLLGAPLAIAFSRRGVVGGVAAAMFLYAALLLSTYLFLALGKGYRFDPKLAAWVPNIAFALVGMFLLHLRSTNRELPRLGERRS
jgi:lipopolysaccharide export system permease protein